MTSGQPKRKRGVVLTLIGRQKLQVREAPPLKEILTSLIQFLSNQQEMVLIDACQ